VEEIDLKILSKNLFLNERVKNKPRINYFQQTGKYMGMNYLSRKQ